MVNTKLLEEIETLLLKGGCVNRVTIDELLKNPFDLQELLNVANRIRSVRAGNNIELCSIINGKSGKCSEDCKFCAQSVHYDTGVETYDRLSEEEILEKAKELEASGVQRFSIVTSGRELEDTDLDWLEKIYRRLKSETSLSLCASHGMLTTSQAQRLKEAGVTTYHHNLETSRAHYESICTTHGFDERVETIKKCQSVGLRVCSGGIFGIDETIEDRISMAFELQDLNVNSVPINFLMPIPGTPMALNAMPSGDEILKMLALYRLILPETEIRFAGGRALLGNRVKDGFMGGVNGALSGNYLTTVGNTVEQDINLVTSLGFVLK